jgi:hypothetical protein
MNQIKVERWDNERIKIIFPYYNFSYVSKIKSIDDYRWHPEEKCWSLPNKDGTLEKLLKLFKCEDIYIDPVLHLKLSGSVIMRTPNKITMTEKPQYNFENIRRELVSRKYSYKTVRAYIYFNQDFINFVDKKPSEVTENNIKDYLVYLAERKQSATSTLNQAINALKFYYGTMLKRKFIYEVKIPRKDRKLPVILSKE